MQIFWNQVSKIAWCFGFMLISLLLLVVGGWWLSKYHFDFVVNKFFCWCSCTFDLNLVLHNSWIPLYQDCTDIIVQVHYSMCRVCRSTSGIKKRQSLMYFCWILTVLKFYVILMCTEYTYNIVYMILCTIQFNALSYCSLFYLNILLHIHIVIISFFLVSLSRLLWIKFQFSTGYELNTNALNVRNIVHCWASL